MNGLSAHNRNLVVAPFPLPGVHCQSEVGSLKPQAIRHLLTVHTLVLGPATGRIESGVAIGAFPLMTKSTGSGGKSRTSEKRDGSLPAARRSHSASHTLTGPGRPITYRTASVRVAANIPSS